MRDPALVARPGSYWGHWLLTALLVLSFVGLNLAWLGQDHGVRDGDEEGHVGAAELFLHDLRAGDGQTYVSRALWDDMGDYPALYPAVVGTAWWASGEGQPDALPVRGVNLVLLLLTGLAIRGAGRNLGLPEAAAALGGASVLWVPLSLGLSRHFMPEVAVTLMAALTVWAATAQDERRSLGPGLLLGLALGCGLLSKQTFPLAVLPPLLFLLRPGPYMIWVGTGATVALPWLLNNWEEQRAYAQASAEYDTSASWADHALYYPQELWTGALGPLWCLALLGLAWLALRGPYRRVGGLGLFWLVAGLGILAFIPKKYDRLMAPLLPAVGLVVGAAAASRPRAGAGLLLLVPWGATVSFADSRWNTPSSFTEDFHPGCAQRWLRPPQPLDLGFEELAKRLVDLPPGDLAVIASPEIPCTVRTTFDWAYHLGPWLRREGLERAVVESPESAVLVVDFSEGAQGEPLSIPILGQDAVTRINKRPRR